MQFDIGRVPFSRAGSYLAISRLSASAPLGAGIYVRTLHGAAQRAEICRIEIFDAEAFRSTQFSAEQVMAEQLIADQIIAEPAQLTLNTSGHSLRWVFSDVATLRCAGAGLGVKLIFPLELYDHAVQRPGGWQINSFSNRMNYALFARRGSWTVQMLTEQGVIMACAEPDADGVLDAGIREFVNNWPDFPRSFATDFEVDQKKVAAEFARWQATLPIVPVRYRHAYELAAYVLWSTQVAANGHLQRPAVLMSKNWMSNVWSWDHCFTAMALIGSDPALAWDQFMLPFDAQETSGALPDCVNDAAMVWNFCKPPIHGWSLQWMLRNSRVVDDEKLREIYPRLCRWTEWWFAQRNDSGDGLPQYNHGNDSGWDNATLFDAGMPMQTPELSAFLVLQMDALAAIADQLGAADDGRAWRKRANTLLENLLKKFWREDHFVAIRTTDGAECVGGTLLLLMPVVLGKRLPSNVRNHLVAALGDSQRFLTAHGLATESLQSPYYAADSYWRGPVWAPVIFLIVEALREIGEASLAQMLAQRFCDTVAQSRMAENFDALSGAGLRDPAHAWTAAVFLLMAETLGDISMPRARKP